MATPKKTPKEPAATQSYETLTEIRLDGDDLDVGSIIELTDKQAEQLLALDAVKPAAE